MAHLKPDKEKYQEKYSMDSDKYGSLCAKPLTLFIRFAVKNNKRPMKNNTTPAAATRAIISK